MSKIERRRRKELSTVPHNDDRNARNLLSCKLYAPLYICDVKAAMKGTKTPYVTAVRSLPSTTAEMSRDLNKKR
jgi:hypothetical protein